MPILALAFIGSISITALLVLHGYLILDAVIYVNSFLYLCLKLQGELKEVPPEISFLIALIFMVYTGINIFKGVYGVED